MRSRGISVFICIMILLTGSIAAQEVPGFQVFAEDGELWLDTPGRDMVYNLTQTENIWEGEVVVSPGGLVAFIAFSHPTNGWEPWSGDIGFLDLNRSTVAEKYPVIFEMDKDYFFHTPFFVNETLFVSKRGFGCRSEETRDCGFSGELWSYEYASQLTTLVYSYYGYDSGWWDEGPKLWGAEDEVYVAAHDPATQVLQWHLVTENDEGEAVLVVVACDTLPTDLNRAGNYQYIFPPEDSEHPFCLSGMLP